jgi:hypothetical protein
MKRALRNRATKALVHSQLYQYIRDMNHTLVTVELAKFLYGIGHRNGWNQRLDPDEPDDTLEDVDQHFALILDDCDLSAVTDDAINQFRTEFCTRFNYVFNVHLIRKPKPITLFRASDFMRAALLLVAGGVDDDLRKLLATRDGLGLIHYTDTRGVSTDTHNLLRRVAYELRDNTLPTGHDLESKVILTIIRYLREQIPVEIALNEIVNHACTEASPEKK